MNELHLYEGNPSAGWITEAVRGVVVGLGWEDTTEVSVRVGDSHAQQTLLTATKALKSAWPEVWSELNRLVQVVVLCNGPFKSATRMQSFGAILATGSQLDRAQNCFELLLHEGGHHTLGLYEQFGPLLHNPTDIASHAFRTDARPLRGVLHAAFASFRMYHGLKRCLDVPADVGTFDPAHVEDRCGELREALRGAVATLEREAQWTTRGEALFAELCEVSAP